MIDFSGVEWPSPVNAAELAEFLSAISDAIEARVSTINTDRFLVLGPTAPIPEGTAADTIIFRTVG